MNGEEQISKEKMNKGNFQCISHYAGNQGSNTNKLLRCNMSMSGPSFTVNWRTGEVIPVSCP